MIPVSRLVWLSLILSERFGHDFELNASRGIVSLRMAGAEGSIIFDRLESVFLIPSSDIPFSKWDAEIDGWTSVIDSQLPAPGVAMVPSPLIESSGVDTIIHYDILGLIYWMMTRVEEIGRSDLDNHDRFPATSSHAFKHGYLERPVVDEWLYVLGQVIQRQWPDIKLKRHQFKMMVSHDVDAPFQYLFLSPGRVGKQIVGDILKRKQPRLAFGCGTCFEYPAFDPVESEILKLRIRPLIVMECSVMNECYLGLGASKIAEDKIASLKDICRMVGGIFTFLFHNSNLSSTSSKKLYAHTVEDSKYSEWQ